MLLPLPVSAWSLFSDEALSVIFVFVFFFMQLRKRDLVAFVKLYYCCAGAYVLCLFLATLWLGQCFVLRHFLVIQDLICFGFTVNLSKTATLKRTKNWFSIPLIA